MNKNKKNKEKTHQKNKQKNKRMNNDFAAKKFAIL